MLLLPVGPLGDPATMAGLLQDLEQLAARSGTGCHECTAPETVGAVGGVLLSLPAPSGAEARERGAQEEALVEAVASFARQAHAAVLAHSASYPPHTHARRPRPPRAVSNDRLRVWLGGLEGARPESGGAAKVGRLHKLGVDVLAPASLGGGGTLLDAGTCMYTCLARRLRMHPACDPASPGECLGSCARTDRPDGLMTTVVAEEGGVALGLVYSNPASLRAAVEAGRGVFWSRSKGGLWRKGDTSGAYQTLLRVDLDCDHDAIRFTVIIYIYMCVCVCTVCWAARYCREC